MRWSGKQSRVPAIFYYNGNVSNSSNDVGLRYWLFQDDVRHTSIQAGHWREPTPYYAEVDQFSGPNGTWVNQSFGDHRRWVGNLRGQLSSRDELQLPSENEGLRQQAEVGALLKLKDQKVNLALAFAERKRTADLFVKTVGSIIAAYRAAKKGNIKEAARQLGIAQPRRMPRDLAGRWLALQYGWKPALADLHGAVELFAAKWSDPRSFMVTVSKNAVKKSLESFDSLGYGGFYCPYGLTREREERVRVSLSYYPNNELASTFASLGLTNPGLIAWELIPFSFVADWVIPVGDFLDSLDAANGMTFRGGSRTFSVRQYSEYKGAKDPVSPTSEAYDLVGYERKFKMNRVVYQSSPIPSFPGFRPWKKTNAAEAAALLVVTTSGAKVPWYMK